MEKAIVSRENPVLAALLPGLCQSNPSCSPHSTPVDPCTCTVRAAPWGGSSGSRHSAGAQHLLNSLAKLHSSLSWGNGTSPCLSHDVLCQRTCCYLAYKPILHQLLTCNKSQHTLLCISLKSFLIEMPIAFDSAAHTCAE